MGDQRIRGNQNVQLQEVENSWVQITYNSTPEILPLESAELPISSENPSPARLVSARAGVFGYFGRAALLADLEAWIDSPAPFAGYLVAGRGGSGKTRLAVELCRRLREWDWLSGFLASGDGEGRLDALIDVPTARLVVIDYAETRAEQLERLLPKLSASATAEAPVRVLLLVRTASSRAEDVPKRLGAKVQALEGVIEGCEVRLLEGEGERLASSERKQLFADAAEAFARYADSVAPPAEPPDLDQDVFQTPLMVVIAAYLASRGEPAPESRGELLEGVLWHERRYWGDSAKGLGADDSLLERVIGLATLLRADSETQAAEHLRLHPDLADAPSERRNSLARWAREQYPGPRWWNPLEPDLVGEHLVARCFTDQPAVLRGALAGEAPEEITRPLEVLARASVDHRALAETLGPVLAEELQRLCGIAVDQAIGARDEDLLYGHTVTAAAALTAVTSVVALDGPSLSASLELMPPRSNLLLNELAATLAMHLVGFLRPLAESQPESYAPILAMALNNGSSRLSDAGLHAEALAASEESVAIYIPLAEADVNAHVRGLASALSNLSGNLANVGRHVDALQTNEASVDLWRTLAEADVAHAPRLADALNNLSNRLADDGRPQEALAAIEESVATYRPLAEEDPSAYAPDLAIGLNNLSLCLANLGRYREALAAIEDAVAAYRPLAGANPAAFAPPLADTLHNLSTRLADAGRHDEALAAIEESVATYRPLAEAKPARFSLDLAIGLNNFSNRLADVGRQPEALETIEESVATYRPLAEANPAAHAPALADALHNLSNRLSTAGRHEEALAAIEESIGTYRPLAEAHPTAYAHDIAIGLNNLANRLADVGRHEEALAAIEESVAAYRPLAEANPGVHSSALAMALSNLADHLGSVGRDADALAATEESVAKFRVLTEANAGFGVYLAAVLRDLARRLEEAGRGSEARQALDEAAELQGEDPGAGPS